MSHDPKAADDTAAAAEQPAADAGNGNGNGNGDRQPTQQPDRMAQPVDVEQPPRLPFIVVGMGASAGGLEAFIEFFSTMRADSGMAFVLIQHLPPQRESMVSDILSKRTRMPVHQVEDGMRVEPDHVYVIRPGHTLTIRDGRLHLGEPLQKPGHNRPVDDFFRSLAEEQRERAIGVVMSGMGSNGTAGAQAIKAVGGVCIAQDPESAKFPSMPRNLIDAGFADFILKPQDMPDALMRYATHPYAKGRIADDALTKERQSFNEIVGILRARTRVEFSGYKKPTLLRRIQRRMGLNQVHRMAEYAKVLRQSPIEAGALADDLMIHVTGFFRDAGAWEALRQRVIGPLVAAKDSRSTIRAWVTACSSGEEAYTLAILLVEAAEASDKPLDIKIFATDTAERSLNHARNGIYPGGIESELSPQRLERFFEKDDSAYRVKKELRELVVFAPQNVLQDPPFSRLDICTCRNLMIYLEPEMQKRVLKLLHFGLREGGALLLGNSETVSGLEELFEPIDKRWRIYRRIGPPRHDTMEFPLPTRLSTEWVEGKPLSRASINHIANRALLERHTPAAVVIDRQMRIVYFHGNTTPFLAQPSGEPTRDLLTLARDSVRGPLRTAVQKSIERAVISIARGGLSESGGEKVRMIVRCEPLDAKNARGHFLVSFEQRDEPPPVPPAAPGDRAEVERGLRDDLSRARDELQSAVEELQTSNEELKASNEEVMSINEELQSTNEELETSKEELQSLNEELTTVNAQLQAKMEELEASTNDLSSLLSSIDVGVIFLDTQLRIRRYTPAVKDLFELIPSDVGRPLSDLARKFADSALVEEAAAVLDKLIPLEREMKSDSGRWYLRRILPYRTKDNRIDGVVVTFIEITPLKTAVAALGQSHDLYRLIFEGVREYAIFMLDLENKITTWNPGAERILGFSAAEVIGQAGSIIFTPEDLKAGAVEQELAATKKHGRAADERWHLRKDGSRFWGSGIMSALYDADGQLRGYAKILRDNTDRKQAEETLREAKRAAEASNEEKDQFLATVSHELRTPLSAILLWSKLLQQARIAPAQMSEGLDAIDRGAEAQKQLIDDLLDSTRIAAGKLRLNLRDIQLAQVINAALDAIRPTAQTKEIVIEAKIAKDVGRVRVDPDRLQQILWNLLTNAVKFTPRGGRAQVRARRAGDEIRIEVADNGQGISPEFLPHLFERFRQADAGATRAQGGLGLGLTITRQLVELHGGTITAASPGLGKGATFTISIPLPRLGESRLADVDLDAAVEPAELGEGLDGVRVLLVEDESATCAAVRAVLENAGAVVTAVASAGAALEAFPKAEPDVIVSDIGMSEMDGYELMRRLRAIESEKELPATPAIALTAFAREVDRKRAAEAGYQRHVAKPPDPQRLIAQIKSLIPRGKRES
jgi:two-component system CheB/CheR fusion protein